jgi:hypothetical protein
VRRDFLHSNDDAAQPPTQARYADEVLLHPAAGASRRPIRSCDAHRGVAWQARAGDNTRDHNLRLAIWLAGWHIEVYDELGEQPPRLSA